MLSTRNHHFLTTYLRPEWRRVALLGVFVYRGWPATRESADRQTVHRPGPGWCTIEQLIWIAVLFLGVAALTMAAIIGETYLAEDLGWRTTNVLRADLTRHVLDLDSGFHGEHSAGELIERIDGDVGAIASFFARFVVQVVGNSLFLLGVLVLLYREDWRIGLVLSSVTVCALIYMTRGGTSVAVRSRDARQAAADVSGYLEERLTGLPDLKSSGADAYAVQRLDEQLARRYERVTTSVMAGQMYNSVVGVLFVLGSGVALVLSVVLYGAGAVTLGTLYVVFRYAGMLRQPLERLTRHMNTALTAAGAIERVDELLATRARVVDGPGAPLPRGALSVDIDSVSFAYEAEPVLRNVSCDVKPGVVLGSVGSDRVGQDDAGAFAVSAARSNRRVRCASAGWTCGARASTTCAGASDLVTQDVQLFHATLRDNVTLFDSGRDGRATARRVRRARPERLAA